MNAKIHDKVLIDLAKYIEQGFRCYSIKSIIDESVARRDAWVEYVGKDYLDEADASDIEKRIEILLGLLEDSYTPERQAIFSLLAHQLHSYCLIASDCPSGLWSKDIHNQVDDILENTFLDRKRL